MSEAKKGELRLGTTAFCKLVGISEPIMRGLEAGGIIKPMRTEAGWRVFSQADVDAAKHWKANKPRWPQYEDGGR